MSWILFYFFFFRGRRRDWVFLDFFCGNRVFNSWVLCEF